MLTCPHCEEGPSKCYCDTVIPDTAGDFSRTVPTKEQPVTLNGYYMWEDWKGEINEAKIQSKIVLTITENTTAEEVEEMIKERLKHV